MKIRFLLLSIIALLAVGCSAFFNMTETSNAGGRLDEAEPDILAPADSSTELNEELRRESEKDFAVDRVVLDESEVFMGGEDAAIVDGIASGYAAPEPLSADGDAIMLSEDMPAAPIVASEAEVVVNQQVSTLKAGEIDDNATWDDYLLYRRESLDSFGQYVNDVDVSRRQIITVVDTDEKPILGATVTISANDEIISRTRTYANGQTLFFPNINSTSQDVDEFTATITQGNQSETYEMNLLRGGPSWEFTLDAQSSRETVKLDVMFLLDATGSMSDEIAQLQTNILSISQQINDMGDVDVRFGLVHYRDRDDAYVTQVHDFTPDVNTFQTELNRVRADGGGDTPESLNAGLHDALQAVEWRGDDTIKVVFLVADAPPHLDYADDFDYAVEMLYAAEQGIKVHPIASSGLDAIGEYIFRQIGQTTMGRFIFLTYAGGTPGTAGDERPDLEASEQDYTVDFLDGLVVRLIEEEIHAYKGETEE